MPTTTFSIRPLEDRDAGAIIQLIDSQRPEYVRFFYALPTDEGALKHVIAKAVRDVYSGLFWQEGLAGIFMLRGWDAGYEVPSFGVLIDERYRGGAFMRLALDSAKLICRLSDCPRLMAKIHPENVSPRGARRLGLIETGKEPDTGNIVYHMEL